MALKIDDYVRLSISTPTVAREFEYFKKEIFRKSRIWENAPNSLFGVCSFYWVDHGQCKGLFRTFDGFVYLSYEEAAAVAYIRYYRATQAFILPEEVRLVYFDLAYDMGNLRAIKIMQGCAGVPQDGIIGPVTREKMEYVSEECLIRESRRLYYKLGTARHKVLKYFKEWLLRKL